MLYRFEHRQTGDVMFISAQNVGQAVQFISENEGPSAITQALHRVMSGDMYVEDFDHTIVVDEFADQLGILMDNDEFEGITNPVIGNLLDALIDQFGGKSRPIVIPEGLKNLNIADTLVLCHGRKSRKISFRGFDDKKAWYVDTNPDEEPDILANMFDLTVDMLPKFRKIVFVACPIDSDPEHIEVAKRFLAPDGEIYITYSSRPGSDIELLQQAKEAGLRYDRRIAINAINSPGNSVNLMTMVFTYPLP